MTAELSTSGDDFSVNGGKITDLAAGVNPTDAANVSQISGGAVSSVFGRTGAVVAVNADYAGIVAAFLTGATQAARFVGGTTSGAPVSGTFLVGDYVVAQDGKIWVCTVAGSPGTWVDVGGSGGVPTSRTLTAGNGLSGGGDLSADRTFTVNVDGTTLEIAADALQVKDDGITAAKIAANAVTESEISLSDVTSDDVTSTAHGFAPKSPADATKFLDGSATPAWDTVKDSDLSTSDITTNDVSITKHGFAPKAPNDATKYLDGTGSYTVPSGSGIPATIVDAKGDLIAATAADTVSRLAVGSNDQVLLAASGQSTGLIWGGIDGGSA